MRYPGWGHFVEMYHKRRIWEIPSGVVTEKAGMWKYGPLQ